MKTIVALAVLQLLCCASLGYGQDSKKDEVIPETVGSIKIVTKCDKDFLPDYWSEDETIKAKVVEASKEEVLGVVARIQEFVNSYPLDVLRGNLHAIHICKSLSMYGHQYAGINAGSTLIVTAVANKNGFTRGQLLSGLHSDFALVLMEDHDFPEEEWTKHNPKGFTYLGDFDKALSDGNTSSEKYLSEGFISGYAKHSLETDFHEIAGMIFTKPQRLLSWCKKHDKIKNKVVVALKFYKSISDEFKFGELETLMK